MFKSFVSDIGKVIDETVYMPNYNDNDEFSVKSAFNTQAQSELQKEHTDYAAEVLGNYSNTYISYYRGVELTPYVVSGVHMPYHDTYFHQNAWWLATQVNYYAPGAYNVSSTGRLNSSWLANCVLGVVVCVK